MTHVPPTAYIGGYIMSAFRKSDDVLFYSILFCSILFSIIYSYRYIGNSRSAHEHTMGT